MSSRPMLTPYSVITADSGNDMTAIIHSIPTIIQNISMISYDISWSGASPVGAITLEVSNTYVQNQDGTTKIPGNWTTLILDGPTNVSGSTGNGFIDVDKLAAFAIRLVYTPASGTGTLAAVITAKVA